MEIPISPTGFESQNLSVETGGIFKGSKVFQNGIAIEKHNRRFVFST
jgi:hypothetical protein